jgi:hypothetical protein
MTPVTKVRSKRMLITLVVAGIMLVKGYSVVYTVGVCLIVQVCFSIVYRLLKGID